MNLSNLTSIVLSYAIPGHDVKLHPVQRGLWLDLAILLSGLKIPTPFSKEVVKAHHQGVRGNGLVSPTSIFVVSTSLAAPYNQVESTPAHTPLCMYTAAPVRQGPVYTT